MSMSNNKGVRLPFSAWNFWTNVRKTRTCWLWTAGLNHDGYGAAFNGMRTEGAHRVAWKITKGPIPGKKQVLHKCDVRACVRPSHLFVGTQPDNVVDMVRKNRHRGAVGVRNCKAKLTPKLVKLIRKRAISGVPGRRIWIALSDLVSYSTVKRVLRGENWWHVS